MRLDRLITLSLVRPVRSIAGRFTNHASRITHLPILMYHSISDDPEPGVRPYYRTCTSPTVFRRQMQYLADNAYRTVTISEAVQLLGNQKSEIRNQKFSGPSFSSLPSMKIVALTFDDGFADFYTHAFPILNEFGFTATVFLPTAYISDRESSSFSSSSSNQKAANTPFSSLLSVNPFPGKRFITWSQVRELRRAGIAFGSHTVNHPKLVDLSWHEIRSEISNSKSEIENRVGEPVTSFCYPYAFPEADQPFVNGFRDLLNHAGYTCCTTTEIGRARSGDDPLRIKRLPINSCDDEPLFAAKLDGAYDWVGRPQAATKVLKRRFVSSCISNDASVPGSASPRSRPCSRKPSEFIGAGVD